MTLYVRIENVMDKESVFITWDHNRTIVKYFPCVFKGVYVLDVSNLLKVYCMKTCEAAFCPFTLDSMR